MAIENLLNQDINIVTRGEVSVYGQPSGSIVSSALKGRVQRVNRLLAMADGRQAVVEAEIWILPGTVIAMGDTLSSGDISQREILTVEDVVDGGGNVHHVKLEVGRLLKKGA